LKDFNAHVANEAVIWKDLIGRHCDAELSGKVCFLLQLWCNNALCTINTFFQFQYKDLLKFTRCRDSLGQR